MNKDKKVVEMLKRLNIRNINDCNDFKDYNNVKYWIAQWSWNPISDGIYPSETTITDIAIYKLPKHNGKYIAIYTSKFNYRFYFESELFDNEKDCQQMCDKANSFGYDYDIGRTNLENWIIEKCECVFKTK